MRFLQILFYSGDKYDINILQKETTCPSRFLTADHWDFCTICLTSAYMVLIRSACLPSCVQGYAADSVLLTPLTRQ